MTFSFSKRKFMIGAIAMGTAILLTYSSAAAEGPLDWFKRILGGIAGAPPIDYVFVPSIPGATVANPGASQSITADNCYIELYLESLRLERARKFATEFNGVAYSFVTLSREGEERARMAAISKPDELTKLDKNSLNRVITVSKQMMGPTAFRGGPVLIQLGLFSVKSGNLLTPILDYITRVSSTAGVSYVGTIKPFLPLIAEGMDLVAGQVQDTVLEVGVDTALNLTTGTVAAVIALPKGTIDVTQLSLDKDRRLLLDGNPLDAGYAVFSLRATTKKSDYGEIPELKERYAAIQLAIKLGKVKDAFDALTAFRLATIASPDLIPSDADRLVKKATQKVRKAFPPGGTANVGASVQIESLSEIGLYD